MSFRTRKASMTAWTCYLQSWVSWSQQCPLSVFGGPGTGVCGKMLSLVLSTQTDSSRMLALRTQSMGGKGVVLSLGESQLYFLHWLPGRDQLLCGHGLNSFHWLFGTRKCWVLDLFFSPSPFFKGRSSPAGCCSPLFSGQNVIGNAKVHQTQYVQEITNIQNVQKEI